MKKLLFTATALIAFSGFSMANTINKNSTKKSQSNEELKNSSCEQIALVQGGNCDGVWGSTRIYALNQGFSADQASCIAMSALINCMGVDASQVKASVGSLC